MWLRACARLACGREKACLEVLLRAPAWKHEVRRLLLASIPRGLVYHLLPAAQQTAIKMPCANTRERNSGEGA